MVHFRANGSNACDSVAAILAQLVQDFAGRLPLTEIDVHDRPDLAALHGALCIDDRQSQIKLAVDELVKKYQSTAREEEEAAAR